FDARTEKRADLLAQRVPDTQPSLPLERYTGSYDSDVYGRLDVSWNDTSLVMRRNAEAIATLTHFNYDTFLATFTSPALRDRLVTFELDKLGHVAALHLEYEARFAATTPPLPNDLAIEDDESPLAGVWSGRWNGVQPTTLAIEHVDGPMAQVVYAWGPAPAWGVDEGGWKRLTARVSGKTLSLSLASDIHVTYDFSFATYVGASYSDGPRQRRATLSRKR
ncbi:MAG: DUF3471 domain-containing protein, partial [Gammaproteobacteria bacterium]